MDDDGHGTIKRGGSGYDYYSFRLVMKIYVTETETKTKTKKKLLFFLLWLPHY